MDKSAGTVAPGPHEALSEGSLGSQRAILSVIILVVLSCFPILLALRFNAVPITDELSAARPRPGIDR